MTAEQLEELLGKVTQGEWYIDGGQVTSDVLPEMDQIVGHVYGPKENATLIALSPSLASRVIAAEKLVEAAEKAVENYYNHTSSYINGMFDLDAALTAYREASK